MASQHTTLDYSHINDRQKSLRSFGLAGLDVWTAVSASLIGLCSVSYFFAAMVIGARSPLWMDEVMASWMSQLPWNKVVDALMQGTMASPPTYFYFLKIVRMIFGGSSLALRMPSIVAAYVAALVVFFLVKRRYSLSIAGLAMVLALETGIFAYAVQVREYTLVTMCFALAVLFWDLQPDHDISAISTAAITILLSLCVALHFYGVLLVVAFGLMEALRSLANGRLRVRIWIPIFIAGSSVFAWYPLMRHIMRLTGSYATAPRYFALPSLSGLLTSYADLAFGGKGMTLLCCLLLLAAALFFWSRITGQAIIVADQHRESRTEAPYLEIIALALVSIPAIVFVFALLVTKTFNQRYAIAGCLGSAIVFAVCISYFKAARVVSCALLLISAGLLAMAPKHVMTDKYDTTRLMATDSEPVVVGEGLAFLELQYSAPEALRKRLVYLTSPANVANPDPTNEDILRRWQLFHPEMRIEDTETFLQAHDHFFVLHTDESMDVITPTLGDAGRLKVVSEISRDRDRRGEWLFEVTPNFSAQVR